METTNEKLASKLFQEVYRLNQTGRYTVFFNYSGHINGIQVYAYKEKWSTEKEIEIMYPDIYLDSDEAAKEINELINKLKEL